VREQVIQKDGRIIRLAPFNMFREDELTSLPQLTITSDGNGFYVKHPQGFTATDVTTLWDRRAK
jgi:hypothetical protein